MTAVDPELDRIGALLKQAIDADLARGKTGCVLSVRARYERTSKAVKWSALAGSASLAAAVLTVVFVGGSAQSAFAGWSAHPTKPAVGQLTSTDTSCSAALAQVLPSISQGADLGSLVAEVSDVRGPYTVTVFGDGSDSGALCFSATDGNAAVQWITWSSAPVGTGAIAVDRTSVSSDGGQSYTLVEGRTGDGVTGVDLTLENGSQVTASVDHGFFVAWWPGSLSSATAVVSTASGISIQYLTPTSSSGSNGVCHNGSCG